MCKWVWKHRAALGGWDVGRWSKGSAGDVGSEIEETWTHREAYCGEHAPWTRMLPELWGGSWVPERISVKV